MMELKMGPYRYLVDVFSGTGGTDNYCGAIDPYIEQSDTDIS